MGVRAAKVTTLCLPNTWPQGPGPPVSAGVTSQLEATVPPRLPHSGRRKRALGLWGECGWDTHSLILVTSCELLFSPFYGENDLY